MAMGSTPFPECFCSKYLEPFLKIKAFLPLKKKYTNLMFRKKKNNNKKNKNFWNSTKKQISLPVYNIFSFKFIILQASQKHFRYFLRWFWIEVKRRHDNFSKLEITDVIAEILGFDFIQQRIKLDSGDVNTVLVNLHKVITSRMIAIWNV